ncbi:exophilin-5-like [Scleropages formosus]|uniref:exophilin-5-like n=1 Tax=Scleropages formosus TaxID=113540 RepID=UPI0008782467|nr:exophilin-5-like [Scleropages formosus]
MMTRVNLSNSNWDINVSLNEEEAAAMRRVLERDSRLRRAERQRVQKLREVSRDDRWLWGVSGQWFQEIKKANREYNSSSGCCSPASFSISKTRSKERRITAKEKNEEHTKTRGIPLRTRLASLFSFRLPQKKNHSKLK